MIRLPSSWVKCQSCVPPRAFLAPVVKENLTKQNHATNMTVYMKKHTKTRLASLAIVACLASTGCENLNSTEAGLIAAGIAGTATGIALGTTGVPAASTIPISLGAAAGAGTLALVATKSKTSADQRNFAEARGLEVVQRSQRIGRPLPQYIMVETISASPSSSRPVMMFDTYTGRVVNNRVYYTTLPPSPEGYTEVPPNMRRW